MDTNAIAQAVQKHGTQRSLAEALGIHPAMVSQWVSGYRPVAAHHVLKIEDITGVSRHVLRPDVFGPEPSTKKSRAA